MMKLTRPAIAGIALLVVTLLGIPSTAAAQTRALARAAVPVETGTWGAVVVAPGAVATPGASHTFRTPLLRYINGSFDLVNTGTRPITGGDLTAKVFSGYSNGGRRYPSLTLDACVRGTWNPQGACSSGTVVALGSTTTGNFASTVALKPGERARVQVSGGLAWEPFDFVVDVAVTRDHTTPPTVSNT